MVDTDKYYDILGLNPEATKEEIKQAYRDLAKVWHPDRFPNDPKLQLKAQEKLKEINEAYSYLRKISPAGQTGQSDYRSQTGQSQRSSSYSASQQYGRQPGSQTRQSQSSSEYSRPQSDGAQKSSKTSSSKPTSHFHITKETILYAIAAVFIIWIAIQNSKDSQTPVSPNTSGVNSDGDKRTYTTAELFPEPVSKASKEENVSPLQKEANRIITKENVNPFKSINKLKEDEKITPTPKLSERYFTIGSTKEEILAIQGEPDKILGLGWFYGDSTVTIYQGKVIGYEDKGNLKVLKEDEKIAPTPKLSGLYFTVGSTKGEVALIQGTPTDLSDYRWSYGESYVDFQDGFVKGWHDSSPNPLKAKMLPANPVTSARDYFTVGSTKDEVAVIQGTPTDVGEYRWYYGSSYVNFTNGCVEDWQNSLENPLKAKLTNRPANPVKATQGNFTIGSTKEEVLAAQGEPDKILGLGWFYGDSYITISNGKVVSYFNKGNLRVIDKPKKITNREPSGADSIFRIGSSKKKVLALQGTPDSIIGNTWYYGKSWVKFDLFGRVYSYSNDSGNLKAYFR